MNTRQYSYPRFTQRHPVSLILLALAPITISLSLATAAAAQEKAATSSNSPSKTEGDAAKTPTKELSVAPLDVVQYPEDRPHWIDTVSDMDGESHAHVAISQPSETRDESLASLEMMQRIAVQLYANKLILADGHPDPFVLDDDWIADNMDRFISREYEGTLTQGDMELYENAVELSFPPQVQEEIRLQWKNAEVRNRLGALGFLVFVGTVLTGCGSAALSLFSRRVERKAAP